MKLAKSTADQPLLKLLPFELQQGTLAIQTVWVVHNTIQYKFLLNKLEYHIFIFALFCVKNR